MSHSRALVASSLVAGMARPLKRKPLPPLPRARRAELPDVLTSMRVASVERLPARAKASPSKGSSPAAAPGPRVRVTPVGGAPREFDAVVLATHSNTALQLLGAGATEAEREVLGAIPYNRCALNGAEGFQLPRLSCLAARTGAPGCGARPPQRCAPHNRPALRSNDVYLHTDEALMPRIKKAWSSWNFIGASQGAAAGDDAAVCVTYWLNRLQARGARRTARRAGMRAPGNAAWRARRGGHRTEVAGLRLQRAHVAALHVRARSLPSPCTHPGSPPRAPPAEPAGERAAALCHAQPPGAARARQGHQAPVAGAPRVQLRLVPRPGARAADPGRRGRVLCG